MSSRMSMMITSAPSRAQVHACARPCPLAPPVMKATLPSSIPIPVLPLTDLTDLTDVTDVSGYPALPYSSTCPDLSPAAQNDVVGQDSPSISLSGSASTGTDQLLPFHVVTSPVTSVLLPLTVLTPVNAATQ